MSSFVSFNKTNREKQMTFTNIKLQQFIQSMWHFINGKCKLWGVFYLFGYIADLFWLTWFTCITIIYFWNCSIEPLSVNQPLLMQLLWTMNPCDNITWCTWIIRTKGSHRIIGDSVLSFCTRRPSQDKHASFVPNLFT